MTHEGAKKIKKYGLWPKNSPTWVQRGICTDTLIGKLNDSTKINQRQRTTHDSGWWENNSQGSNKKNHSQGSNDHHHDRRWYLGYGWMMFVSQYTKKWIIVDASPHKFQTGVPFKLTKWPKQSYFCTIIPSTPSTKQDWWAFNSPGVSFNSHYPVKGFMMIKQQMMPPANRQYRLQRKWQGWSRR